jgi:hypothetical protein
MPKNGEHIYRLKNVLFLRSMMSRKVVVVELDRVYVLIAMWIVSSLSC